MLIEGSLDNISNIEEIVLTDLSPPALVLDNIPVICPIQFVPICVASPHNHALLSSKNKG
jgi:hypothetical protein